MATIADLAEALTSSQTAALLQKRIDAALLDVFRKEDPLKGALPTKDWNAAVFYWNTRNRLPYAQAVVEAPPTSGTGSVSPTQSNYIQSQVPIAHYQVNGDLSKFNIKVAHASIENLLDEEMTAATQSMAWMQSMFHIYGSAGATVASVRPQWDGFDRLISNTNRLVPNAGAGTSLTFLDLDNMIDAVRTKIAAPLPGEDFFFLTSEPMLSKIGRLMQPEVRQGATAILKPRRMDGITGQVVTAEGGVEVPAYRGIPILGTSFLTPTGTMTVVTATATGADGATTLAARYYAVEAITQYGPMYCATATVTPAAATNHVDLTFATPAATDIFGNNQPILQYRVYEGATANSLSLYAVVAATDTVDLAVTTIRDLGSNGVLANPGANQVLGVVTGASNVAGDGVNIAPPSVAPAVGYDECMWLATRKPEFVCVPTVTEIESEILANVNARTVQYALVGDCALAMRAPAFAAKLMRVATA